MNKAVYILTAAALTFASADATTHPKASIRTVFQEMPNGDYRLFIFGTNRALVCEEHPIQIASQGDAVYPVVIECNHSRAIGNDSDHWQP